MSLTHATLFGNTFTLGKLTELVQQIVHEATGATKKPKALMVVSMQDIVAQRRQPMVAAAFKKFDVFTPDGMPLVWLARLLGHSTERLYGPDIFEAVLAASASKNVKHFFYGADDATLQALIKICKKRWPKLTIVGTIAPPFRPLTSHELKLMAQKINATRPSIVWVGLGSWKQLLFTAAIKPLLQTNYIIPVGMAFDVLAQRKQQAPQWMQQNGLEWLFRLGLEPVRLWQRYIFSVPVFVLWWMQELWSQKLQFRQKQELRS